MKLKTLYKKSRAIGTFFVLALIASCTSQPEEIGYSVLTGNAIGTTYSIAQHSSTKLASQASIDTIIAVFDAALSTYKPNSLLSIFNDNFIMDWPELTKRHHFETELIYLKEMIVRSRELYTLTDSSFDPSAQPLFELWSKAKDHGVIPDSYVVRAALFRTGLMNVGLDMQGYPYRTNKTVELNFNAIAKGYLVDVVAEYLDELGVENYMVEIGGEIRTKGKSSSMEKWRIGVNTPNIGAPVNDVFEVIELGDQAMATSGNYRNYFVVADSIIGHTLDPRTGYPVNNSLRSATIIANDCATADALATASMVVGYNEARKWIEDMPGVSAFFIIEKSDGTLEGIRVD